MYRYQSHNDKVHIGKYSYQFKPKTIPFRTYHGKDSFSHVSKPHEELDMTNWLNKFPRYEFLNVSFKFKAEKCVVSS